MTKVEERMSKKTRIPKQEGSRKQLSERGLPTSPFVIYISAFLIPLRVLRASVVR